MLISAVVLSFNADAHIRGCVEALVTSFVGLDEPCEIFVVENGSVDNSPAILKELESRHPDVLDVTYLESNHGTTKPRNLAIRRSQGQFVLIIDADAVATEVTLRRLLQVMREQEKCGIAVPKLIYPNGTFQLSVDRFPTLQHKIRRAFRLKQIEQTSGGSQREEQLVDVDYAISAFWLVRRSLFDEVGLLDERIFYSPEDVDFCLRTWKSGWHIMFDSSVTAVHDARELSRGLRLNGFKIRHVKGLIYYFFKHRYLFSPPRLSRDSSRQGNSD